MSSCVLDASASLTWSIDVRKAAELDPIFADIFEDGATVPILWHTEILNGLLLAERAGRMTADGVRVRMSQFLNLPLTVDADSPIRYRNEIVELARRHRLTAYDATYLELTMRAELPLATLDQALAAAARREGVPLLIA